MILYNVTWFCYVLFFLAQRFRLPQTNSINDSESSSRGAPFSPAVRFRGRKSLTPRVCQQKWMLILVTVISWWLESYVGGSFSNLCEQWEKPWLFRDIGDCTTQLCGDYHKPLYIRIPIKQPVQWKVSGFCFSWLKWWFSNGIVVICPLPRSMNNPHYFLQKLAISKLFL